MRVKNLLNRPLTISQGSATLFVRGGETIELSEFWAKSATVGNLLRKKVLREIPPGAAVTVESKPALGEAPKVMKKTMGKEG